MMQMPESDPVYNTDLPSAHSYLGYMKPASEQTEFTAHKTYRLALMPLNHIVFPGEKLPWRLSTETFDHMRSTYILENVHDWESEVPTWESDLDKKPTVFGAVFSKKNADGLYYGVSCHVLEKGLSDGRCVLLTRAQHRFVVLPKHNESIAINMESDCTDLNVTILPEQDLPDALLGKDLSSVSKFNLNARQSNKLRSWAAGSVVWPRFVYDRYDTKASMWKVKCFLSAMDIKIPDDLDPIAFTFWCTKHIGQGEQYLWDVFVANTTAKRILTISQALQYNRYYTCKGCVNKIAHFNALFTMTRQGALSSFLNPNGNLFEVNTFHSTIPNAVVVCGIPSESFSWFPLYAWQIIYCGQCTKHLGWKFTVGEGRNLPIKSFYGLTASALNVELDEENDDDIHSESESPLMD